MFSKEKKVYFRSFFATQQLVIMSLALAQTCFELQMKALNKPITAIIGCQTCYNSNSNNNSYEKKIQSVAHIISVVLGTRKKHHLVLKVIKKE